MKLLALNNQSQVSPFILKVFKITNADGFLWMDKNQCHHEVDGRQILNFSYGDSLDHDIKIIIFDIFLVPTLVFLKKYMNCKFVYIQHGLFSDLTVDFRNKKKTLTWLLKSLNIAFRFLNVFGWSYKNIILLGDIFKNGGWHARKLIGDLPISIESAIFWNELDKENIFNQLPRIIKTFDVIESPDKSLLRLKYCPNGKVIYISQPLVEDSVVSEAIYESFLQSLYAMYGRDLIVIKHPRIIQNFVDQRFLAEINSHIKARLVLGHYSSLILSVHQQIPVEFCDLGVENITKYCKYIEKSRLKLTTNNNVLKPFESISTLI